VAPAGPPRPPKAGGELARSLLLGTGVAVLLFLLMALAQVMKRVDRPDAELEERTMAFNPPEIEEMEEEPPPEEDPPPPEELEEPPPELSLEQLEIALNPGTGGALAGDFSLPGLDSAGSELGTEEFVKFSSLDQVPRPVGVAGIHFPRHLRNRPANGRIVLLVDLSPEGEVLEVEIESSDLPRFNDFVVGQVKDWRFTPPTQKGQPVQATARLPIPIRIN